MLNQYGRFVNYYRLNLKPTPDGSPQSDLASVMDPLLQLVTDDAKDDGERTLQLRNNETASVEIAAMERTANHYILLLQYCDTKASDPVFKSLKRRAIRIAGKARGEGVATSAHIVVHRVPLQSGTHTMALEQVPGLGPSSVERYLTYMFRQIAEAAGFSANNAQGKPRSYRPLAKIDIEPSDTLLAGLQAGRLQEISLITRQVELDFDEAAYTTETEHIVKTKVDKRANVTEQLSLLNRFKRRANETKGNNELRAAVRIGKKSQTVEIPPSVQDAGSVLFAKYDYLEVTRRLDQCSDAIRMDLAKPMGDKAEALHRSLTK